jgi:elongation factor Ts
MGKAEEILRVKLGNKATKAAARITAEGLVAVCVSDDGKRGAIVEVNCETDFVARNEEFQALTKKCAAVVLDKNPADIAALSALPLDGGTVESVRAALIGKIGENLSIRRFTRVEAKGRLFSYVHGGAKIGTLVDLVGGDDQLGKDLAMQVAASKPRALSAEDVPADLLETERRIAMEKARADDKPEEMLARIADGAVQKYLKEVVLPEQVFVKAENGKQTVGQLLKAKGATLAGFTLYVVGEGLEKRANDFAAEVAAQAEAAARKGDAPK